MDSYKHIKRPVVENGSIDGTRELLYYELQKHVTEGAFEVRGNDDADEYSEKTSAVTFN